MPHETEAGFQRAVIDLARLCGWLVHHTRPAWTAKGYRTPIMGDVGFPDLVLCHPKRGVVIFAELKVGKNPASAEQVRWLDALRGTGAAAGVWRETDWPDIERTLKEGLT